MDLASQPLGESLVAAGLLTADQRDWALDVQRRTGSRLGEIVVAAGLVRRDVLYRALARAWDCPFVDLRTTEPDPRLLRGLDPEVLGREGWLPLRRQPDGRILVATSVRPGVRRLAAIAAVVGAPVEPAVTTDWDVLDALRRGFRGAVLDRAAFGLWRRSTDQSARAVLVNRQKVAFGVAGVVLAVATALSPLGVLGAISLVTGLTFLASVLFKFVICMVGVRLERDEGVTDADVAAVRDDDLPRYTVLVPLYRESNVVGDLIANLSALDYPVEKLEILILLEEDDTETIAAVRAIRPPEQFRLVIVPDGRPKTKPKACNVGLFFARGEYLTIYDAEDKPDPDQLKKAVLAFRKGSRRLVCVQAALNYWNDEDNFLTRMFTLEYSFWFDYMLPGLQARRLPIPLGGTSNHFRTEALRRLGGWDPFNVTEDADLGIRASALGYRVGVINSTTYEEANRAVGNWIRQRSRWIKGYLQTFLVHLRHPGALVRAAGAGQALAFALLIGGTPLTFLFAVPLWLMFVASLCYRDALAGLFPDWLLIAALLNLLIGNALMIYVCMMGAFKRRRYRLVAWALLNPVYWVLHSIAAYRALWQLITRPHYWEKTLHGLSTLSTGAAPGRVPVAAAAAIEGPRSLAR